MYIATERHIKRGKERKSGERGENGGESGGQARWKNTDGNSEEVRENRGEG